MMFVYTINISHQTAFSTILVGFLHASSRYDTWCKYFASNHLLKNKLSSISSTPNIHTDYVFIRDISSMITEPRHTHSCDTAVHLWPFLTRNIFDKYLGCLGPKKLSKIFLENIIWEIWEATYGSEIFFSLFDGGMWRRFDEVSPGEQMIILRSNKFQLTRETPSAAVLLCTHSPRSTTSTQNIQQ